MVERTEYLERLKSCKDEKVIKVVMGIRRCGKSTLLQQYRDYLLEMGTSEKQIVFINFEELEYEDLIDYKSLYKYLVSKVGSTEVDFVAQKNDKLHYYQVTASLTDENTFNREITPLQNLHDNYPKTILTLDRFTLGDYDGIEVVNAVDWLLM